MKAKPDYYEFAGVRVFVDKIIVKEIERDKKHSVSKIHWGFLLELLENAPNVVLYEDLWKRVWGNNYFDETSKHTIQTTKGQIVQWFKTIGIEYLPIEASPGKGYFLSSEVSLGYRNDSDLATQIATSVKTSPYRNYLPFILPASVLYGFQFPIVTFMEIAYQFEKYWQELAFWGIFFWIINSLFIYLTFLFISRRLESEKYIVLPGILILLVGAILTLLLAINLFPLQPVTQAVYQTQPALIAFGKNVLIYILPLAILFLLLPFSIVYARNLAKDKIIKEISSEIIILSPKTFFLIWAGILVFSIITTNFMLDRLNADSGNHWIFVGLIFLRTIFYFGITLAALIWYQIKISRMNS